MWHKHKQNQTLAGILLAILATLIWSGNFIIVTLGMRLTHYASFRLASLYA
jgi:hypothetical protein